jgi:class 3 adenylate cyclase
MRDLPRGTVTFLFTDVEGSTRLLKELRDGYADVLAKHQRILREAFEAAGGQEIDTQGDSFFVAFPRAKDAVTAAVAAQRGLAAHRWPKNAAVRVRMGLHTGEPTVGEERYVGLGVHKAARIAAAAHGGQILLSNTTRGLVEDELPPDLRLTDLGEHRLKDIDLPERIFQLNSPGLPHRFPPLRLEAPLPRSRAWSRPARMPRERALLAAAAALALAAAVVGIAVAMGRHETNSSGGDRTSSTTASGPTAPGRDPSTIVPGRSIGAVKLGMSEPEVKNLYGGGREGVWLARGRTGSRVIYSGEGAALTVSFYDRKVVQVGTSSKYYTTSDGVRVGLIAPDLAPQGLDEALRKHEVVEINPGVYTWKNFEVDSNGGGSFCLRDEKAATQLVTQGGPSNRIGSIWITDARFLSYLPAHIALSAGRPALEIFCAAQPLQP